MNSVDEMTNAGCEFTNLMNVGPNFCRDSCPYSQFRYMITTTGLAFPVLEYSSPILYVVCRDILVVYYRPVTSKAQ